MTQNLVKRNGTMFIFSAPSGGGKSSVIKGVLKKLDDVELSVSVTTRAMREGEVEGKDYFFITEDKFSDLVKDNALYEYVNSDFGPKYGTPREPVDKLLAQGKDVFLDLDYPGVQQLRKLANSKIKTIFLMPPSLKILRERLVNRGTDTMEIIEKRMSMAEKRVNESRYYDYIVVNDDLDRAISEVLAIISATRCESLKIANLENLIKEVTEDK